MSNSDDMGWIAESLEWLLTFLSGEKRLSEDYIPKAGDEIGITNKYTIDEELDDDSMISALDSVSNAEIEHEFYAQGLDISVTNRRSQIVTSKHEWTHEVDFEVRSAETPALIVLAPLIIKLTAIAITFIFGYLIVQKLTATTDKIIDKSEAGAGLTVNILIIGIVILVLIWFFMSVMRR